MNTAAEEEINSSSNKEISTVDVNVETVSKFEDHPMSKSSAAIMKNSILPDLPDHEFTNEAESMSKMALDHPNLSYIDNYNTNNHKVQEPIKRRFNNDDKNDSDGPTFLEEPEDVLLVRNKASTLKCTVKNALNAWFECSSGDPDSLQNKQIGNYVDPQTGIRTIEIHIEVSKQNLEDHVKRINDIQTNYKFNGQEAQKAKNSRNKQYHYKNAILDDQANDASDLPLVKSEQTAAHPDLQLTKLLNNVRLNETTTNSPTSSPPNSSMINSQLSSLIALMKSNEIYRFQCWCKSFGGHRTVESRKASIELSFNGGWSDWTEWSECNTKCGRGTQRRFRYCNNPTPINDGLKCTGESLQTNECFVPCSNHGSQWSQWSTCSSDCKQVRSRQCKVKESVGLVNSYSSSDGCQGQDVESKPCTGGLCSSGGSRKLDRKDYNKDFGNSIQGLNQLDRTHDRVNLERSLDRNQQLNNNQLSNNQQPVSPSNVQQNSDQIFILCSLLATSLFFLLLLILFILLKQRKRHFKNKNKATILRLDKLGNEEQQQMLLLMQQTQQTSSLNRNNPPAQILINSNNRGYLQQPPPISNQQNQSSDLVRSEKMHLITRLNHQGGSIIDHLLVRNSDNLQQQLNSKRISPFNTINGNLQQSLNHQSNQTAISSNSNVSSSLTTASVNSNPSHNSSADEE